MAGSKRVMAAAIAGVMLAAFSTGAQAHRRCGYDRYGYLPPDFRGCYWNGYGPAFYPVYEPYPPRAYYGRFGFPPPGCYFDNGYDLRAHLICPR